MVKSRNFSDKQDSYNPVSKRELVWNQPKESKI